MDFVLLNNDSNVFHKKGIIIVIYVNNLLIVSRNHSKINNIKIVFNKRFHMMNLKLINYYLSIIIIRNR